MPFILLIMIFFVFLKESLFESLILLTFLELCVYTVSLFKVWFHVVMMLILLEFFSVKLFLVASLELLNSCSQMMIFSVLVLMVTEASMGMSLVVNTARSWGDSAMIIYNKI